MATKQKSRSNLKVMDTSPTLVATWPIHDNLQHVTASIHCARARHGRESIVFVSVR
jgi:hypothetical protein